MAGAGGGALLQPRWPGTEVTLVELSTEGDRILDAPLSRIGGKGLFVKELEAALLDGRADLAVHSLKDVTSAFPPGLVLAAVPEREDPRDAWVSPGGAAASRRCPAARGSGRRRCAGPVSSARARPDVEVVPLRGNVGTRLRKTAELGLAGAILALAGPPPPRPGGRGHRGAPGGGRCSPRWGRARWRWSAAADAPLRPRLEALEHARPASASTPSAASSRRLEGGCTVPLAAHAVWEGEALWVRGLVGAPDGSEVLRAERRGPAVEARALGRSLAAELLDRGPRALLASHAGERSGV